MDATSSGAVSKAVASLKRRGLLYRRGAAGGYCLWPATSVNLESAFKPRRARWGQWNVLRPC